MGVGAVVLAACGRSPTPGLAGATQAGTSSIDERAIGDRVAARAPALSYLHDDYERMFPDRVRLARYGAVRLAAGDRGDAAGWGDGSDPTEMGEAPVLVVVDQVGERLRVVTQEYHYRLLLWIDAADLYTVVAADGGAWLRHQAVSAEGSAGAGAGVEPGGGAVRLLPGLPVDVERERGRSARVNHHDGCIAVSGWVAREHTGMRFTAIEIDEAEDDHPVAAGTVVLDRPGGRPLARFLADCEVLKTGAEVGEHWPILYSTEWIEVRGWITSASGPSSGGTSWGPRGPRIGFFGLGERSRLRLPEGTCLYARRGGPIIGLVTDDVDMAVASRDDGGWKVAVETAWGELSVWVAEEGGQPSQPAATAKDDGQTPAAVSELKRCR